MSSSWGSAVIIITARASPFFLSWLRTCNPLMSGKRTSSRTRSGDSCCASFSPGSPASASTTWYPHSSHFCRSDQRTRRSSSTIMIFSAGTMISLLRKRKIGHLEPLVSSRHFGNGLRNHHERLVAGERAAGRGYGDVPGGRTCGNRGLNERFRFHLERRRSSVERDGAGSAEALAEDAKCSVGLGGVAQKANEGIE